MKRPQAKTLFISFITIFLIGSFLWWLGGVAQKNIARENLIEIEKTLQREQALTRAVTQSLLNSNSIEQYTSPKNNITASQLKLTTNNSPENLKKYGQNLVKILSPYTQKKDNQIKVMLSALENHDQQLINEIKAWQEENQKILNQLLALTIPSQAELIHLQLINSINYLIPLLGEMSQVLENPEKALSGAEKYMTRKIYFLRTVDNINAFFANQGIIFNEEESLQIFTDF